MKKIGAIFLLMMMLATGWASSLYPFESEKQQAQFSHLLKSLRCLVCQNQDLADSNAPLAKDLRATIYEWVQQGRTDSEIIADLQQRYGDFILFNPPVKGVTALLWGGPIGFLLIGLFIFWRSFIKRDRYA